MSTLPLDLRPLLKTLPSPRPPFDNLHSPIGPSAATRLIACPASHATAELLGREIACTAPLVAAAAERGSREHALVEAAIQDNFLPEIVEEFDGYPMGAAARLYIETVTDLVQQAAHVDALFIEETLDGRAWHEFFFGTVDAGLVWRDATNRPRLSIIDLKTGNYLVGADALQLKLYAALMLLDPRTRVLTRNTWYIDCTVVQPHIRPVPADGPVRTAQFTRQEILDSAKAYLELADAATALDAVEVLPRRPGDHCIFCPAKPVCPARQAQREAHAALLLSPVNIDADTEAAFDA
jgi:hypothetical protein